MYLDPKINLDHLFLHVATICRKFNIPANTYEHVVNAYSEYTTRLQLPKKNRHYIFCPWSVDNSKCGPDTCPCSTLHYQPKRLVNSLLAAVGLDIILALIHDETSSKTTCDVATQTIPNDMLCNTL